MKMSLRDASLVTAGALGGAAVALFAENAFTARSGDDQPIIMSGGSINIAATGVFHTFEQDGTNKKHVVHSKSGTATLGRVVPSVEVITADGSSFLSIPGNSLKLEITCPMQPTDEVITFQSTPGNPFTIHSRNRNIADDLQHNHAYIYIPNLSVSNIKVAGSSYDVAGAYLIVIHYFGSDSLRWPRHATAK
jgi:hypothetical protein